MKQMYKVYVPHARNVRLKIQEAFLIYNKNSVSIFFSKLHLKMYRFMASDEALQFKAF